MKTEITEEQAERLCPKCGVPMQRRDLRFHIAFACTNRECPAWETKWKRGYEVWVSKRTGREV